MYNHQSTDAVGSRDRMVDLLAVDSILRRHDNLLQLEIRHHTRCTYMCAHIPSSRPA